MLARGWAWRRALPAAFIVLLPSRAAGASDCDQTVAALRERLEQTPPSSEVPASAPAWLKKLAQRLREAHGAQAQSALISEAWSRATAGCREPFTRPIDVADAVLACGCRGIDVDALEAVMRLNAASTEPPEPAPVRGWTVTPIVALGFGVTVRVTPGAEAFGTTFDSSVGVRLIAPMREPAFALRLEAGYSYAGYYLAAMHLLAVGVAPALSLRNVAVAWSPRFLAGMSEEREVFGVRNGIRVCSALCVVLAEIAYDYLWVEDGRRWNDVRVVFGLDLGPIFQAAARGELSE